MMSSNLKAALELPSLISESLLSTRAAFSDISLLPSRELIDLALSRITRSSHQMSILPKDGTKYPLGRFFENAVKLCLTAGYSNYDIQTNIKIQSSHEQGELDFVLTSIISTIHIEVALKFFLYRPSTEPFSLADFHGPNLNDRFDLKLDKILLSQLRKRVPSEYQAAASISQPKKALWLAGILYYPWNVFHSQSFPSFHKVGINPFHEKGWWARPSELKNSNTPIIQTMYALPKSHWLKPWDDFTKTDKARFHVDLGQEINFDEPIYAQIFRNDGLDIPRGFLVPETW